MHGVDFLILFLLILIVFLIVSIIVIIKQTVIYVVAIAKELDLIRETLEGIRALINRDKKKDK